MTLRLMALVFFGCCVVTNAIMHHACRISCATQGTGTGTPFSCFVLISPHVLFVYIDICLCFDSSLVTVPILSLVCFLIVSSCPVSNS